MDGEDVTGLAYTLQIAVGQSSGNPKVEYLKFIRDVVLPRTDSEYVVARRYPEFGKIYRSKIQELIELEEYQPTDLDVLPGDIVYGTYGADSYITPSEENSVKSAEWYQAEAERMLEMANKTRGIPTEDIFDEGRVLTFTKTWGGEAKYNFAAIKIENSWFLTGSGRRAEKIYNWSDLLGFVGLDGLETIKVVTESVPLREYADGLKRALDKA
jgi:hypothetical protein